MLVDEDIRAAHDMSDPIPLVKAYLFGNDEVPATNVVSPENLDMWGEEKTLPPPFDLEMLVKLYESSSALRQCVDAYTVNIDGFGHRLEPILHLDKEESNFYLTYQLENELGRVPNENEIVERKDDVAGKMRSEKFQLENFFRACSPKVSFVTLRRWTRQDIEVLGNAYWEVRRDAKNCIARFEYVPAFTVRLLPLDKDPIEIDMKVRTSPFTVEDMPERRFFRRFVQAVDQKRTTYYKEFGDPRCISRKTGKVIDESKLEKNDKGEPVWEGGDGPASEILHFKIHSPRTPYGIPRWIGAVLAVLGTRQAEEINYLYFQNKSVPPLALLVSGGRLSANTVKRIENYIENNLKGKKNFHKILVLEAEGGVEGRVENPERYANNGRMKIELKPLNEAQLKDGLFMQYQSHNLDLIGQTFRLPRLLRGDIRDFNRSTADAAVNFTEMQVFQPEREEFDFMINNEVMMSLGATYWKFVSNAPVTRDPATMADIVAKLLNAGALVPAWAQMLAGDIFNRDFPVIKADWVHQPIQLTLGGVQVQHEDRHLNDTQQAQAEQPGTPPVESEFGSETKGPESESPEEIRVPFTEWSGWGVSLDQ